jgi:hypothetical protein
MAVGDGIEPGDAHNNICAICDSAGSLLCCDVCTLVYHIKCAKLSKIPPEDIQWKCPDCISTGRVLIPEKAGTLMYHLVTQPTDRVKRRFGKGGGEGGGKASEGDEDSSDSERVSKGQKPSQTKKGGSSNSRHDNDPISDLTHDPDDPYGGE